MQAVPKNAPTHANANIEMYQNHILHNFYDVHKQTILRLMFRCQSAPAVGECRPLASNSNIYSMCITIAHFDWES